MKNVIRIGVCIVVFLAFFSCQNEENSSELGTETISGNAALATLLKQATANNTKIDDIIDTTACFSIQLPFQVTLNGEQIQVNDETGYQLAEQILNPPLPNGNSIEFAYPITLLDSAYNAVSAINFDQLQFITGDCVSPATNNAGCVALQYPLTIFGFDASAQLENTYTLVNDAELFGLLKSFQPDDYFQISYPISVSNAFNDIVTVTSNAELQEVIVSSFEQCQNPNPQCENPHILTDDLVIYIPFANETADLTGFATPTVTGNYHYVTDRSNNPNGAISLDDGDSENFISVPGNDSNDFTQNTSFAVSLWFNRQTQSTTVSPFEVVMNSADLSISLGNPQDNTIASPFLLGTNLEALYDIPWIDTGMTQEIGVWHHLVVTYDGIVIQLYRDGILRSEAIAQTPFASSPGATFGAFFKGYLDDIRIYKRTLTAQEVQILFDLEGDVYQCLN